MVQPSGTVTSTDAAKREAIRENLKEIEKELQIKEGENAGSSSFKRKKTIPVQHMRSYIDGVSAILKHERYCADSWKNNYNVSSQNFQKQLAEKDSQIQTLLRYKEEVRTLHSLSERLAVESAKTQSLLAEVEFLQANTREGVEELERVKGEIQRLRPYEHEANALRSQVGEIQDLLRREVQGHNQCKVDLRQSQQEKASITCRFAYVRDELSKEQAETGRLRPFEEEASTLRPRIGEIQDSIRLEKRSHQECKARLEQCQQQKSSIVRRFGYVQEKIIAQDAEVQRLRGFEAEADELRPRIGELQDSLREEKRTHGACQSALQRCQLQKGSIVRRFAHVQDELVVKQTEIRRLRGYEEEAKTLRVEVECLRSQCVSFLRLFEEEVSELQETNGRLRAQVAGMEAAWEAHTAEAAEKERDKSPERIQELEAEIAMLENIREWMADDARERSQDQAKQMEEAQVRQMQLEDKYDRKVEEVERLRLEAQDVRAIASSLERQLRLEKERRMEAFC